MLYVIMYLRIGLGNDASIEPVAMCGMTRWTDDIWQELWLLSTNY